MEIMDKAEFAFKSFLGSMKLPKLFRDLIYIIIEIQNILAGRACPVNVFKEQVITVCAEKLWRNTQMICNSDIVHFLFPVNKLFSPVACDPCKIAFPICGIYNIRFIGLAAGDKSNVVNSNADFISQFADCRHPQTDSFLFRHFPQTYLSTLFPRTSTSGAP